jgi:nicotinamidase-related amidase
MQVIPLFPQRAFREASAIVAFIDYQREYVTPGRPFALGESEPWLARSRSWLEKARALMLPIAHFRQYRSGTYFNRASPFSDWIDGFRPRTDETLYERSQPSCYADSGFADFTAQVRDPLIILAGPSADQACLATAVEASGRGHRVLFIADCSASPALGDLGAAQSHAAVSQVIANYADVLSLEQLIGQLGSVSANRSFA